MRSGQQKRDKVVTEVNSSVYNSPRLFFFPPYEQENSQKKPHPFLNSNSYETAFLKKPSNVLEAFTKLWKD